MSTADLAAGELPGTPVLAVRRAQEFDAAALADMFARCSSQTRYRRFHGHITMFPARYMAGALVRSPVHAAFVACLDDGRVVGLAECHTVAPGVAELAFLVEDAWQRLGIGRALLREVMGHADRSGLRTLTAQVLAEQSWIVGVLGTCGPCESGTSRGVLDVTVRRSAL
jgi:GNAT superfamily N-acetyltransferase